MRQQRVDNDSEIRMSMRDVRDRQTYIQREREGEREGERERERAYGGREYETWANSQFYEGSRWLWGSIGARCWPAIDLPTVHRSVNSRSCWISERIARREWVGHKTSMLEKHGWYGVPNQNETRQQGLMSNKFYTIYTTEDCKTSPERPMILPCLPPTREKNRKSKNSSKSCNIPNSACSSLRNIKSLRFLQSECLKKNPHDLRRNSQVSWFPHGKPNGISPARIR